MTNSNKTEGGGLVQKLLFPGYTQSGANDTFHANSSATALLHKHNNNSSNDNEDHNNSQDLSFSTMSQADTEVCDNRSRSAALLQQPKQQPQQQQPLSSTTTTIPQVQRQMILPRWKQQPTAVPPLFASTQPPRNNNNNNNIINSIPVVPPSSPPKLARKPFGAATERSLSNVALADGHERANDKHGLRQDGLPLLEDKNKSVTATTATRWLQQVSQETKNNNEETTNLLPSFSRLEQSSTAASATMTSPTRNDIDDDNAGYHSEHKDSDNVVWQEEATPAQTALAKDIIFRHRVIERSKSADHAMMEHDGDVSSTASEMGTVIGAAQLQDLDRDFGNTDDITTTTTKPSSPSETDQLMYSKHVFADRQQQQSTAADKHDVARSPRRTLSHDLSAEASQRLSRAIRRIGSGIAGGNLPSRSAPSTPRPSHEENNASPRTPSWKLQPSSSVYYNHHQNRGATPNSFLLRSPGSLAFCAASRNNNTNYTNNNKEQQPQRNNALLSPRVLQVPPAIEEDKQSSSRPGPSLPELHPLSSMARACFSFDAYYYHEMDDARYDMPADFARNTTTTNRRRSPQRSPRRSDNKNKNSSSNRTQWLHESQSWDVGARETGGHRGKMMNESFQFLDKPLHNSSNNTERQRPRGLAQQPVLSNNVEHEDALDLLACLVERGISLESAAASATRTTTAVTGDEDDTQVKLLEQVRTALAAKEQQDFIDRLLRSHEYALEMSRASQSAASWLKSIGRSTDIKKHPEPDLTQTTAETKSLDTSSAKKDDDSVDLVTARALMHSAQKELADKASQMEELNQELAKCRAEIGRLRTQQQQQQQLVQIAPFQSPNRSILDSQNEDDEDDDDDDDALAADLSDGYLDRSFRSQSRRSIFGGVGELEKYKKALEEANEKIRELYQKTNDAQTDKTTRPAPIITVTPFTTPPSPGGNTADTDTMDEDNFETQWADLVPSLPPPPDHGLQSPIVQTVLQAWTPDTDLHESLLAWMETVMSGASPHDIPPLAISNLDSQVRDGLVMHVLPLLLRRADIRVEVQTRTLRRTTYDLAVAVETSLTPLLDLPLRRRHWENLSARSEAGVSVTHSTATALAENREFPTSSAFRERYGRTLDDPLYGQNGKNGERNMFPYPLIHQDAMATNTGFSYDEMTEDLTADGSAHPPGLMSALGDALGGLMLRRPSPRDGASPAAAVVGSHFPEADRYRSALKDERNGPVEAQLLIKDDPDKTPTTANGGGSTSSTSAFTPQSALLQPQATTPMLTDTPDTLQQDDHQEEQHQPQHSQHDEEQPYHRVVSAPPGRIGVTFVEYRGHAMVSKVSTDSPLAGWMFPSDILIAIDELPVSGMRVRDIIQILRERVDNQRALRIISSHAMDHAFSPSTLNTSSQFMGEPTG